MEHSADTHALELIAEDVELALVAGHDKVLAELWGNDDALGAKVELNSMGKVVRVIKLQLILEKQLRLVRVLEVDAELVVSVNCDQKT